MNEQIDERELKQLEDELRPSLSAYVTAPPSREKTNALVRTLLPELEQSTNALRPSIFKQCIIQMRHYRLSFWAISIAIFLMLSLATPVFIDREDIHHSLFSFILPLYVLVGIGYSYRSWNKEMRMVEMVTPFPPALLLLIRMINILAINVFLGLLGSAYLAVELSIMPMLFILEWLAPSIFMFGLFAYIMLWKGMKAGMITVSIVWLAALTGPIIMNELAMTGLIPPLLLIVMLVGIGLFTAAYRRAVKHVHFQM